MCVGEAAGSRGSAKSLNVYLRLHISLQLYQVVIHFDRKFKNVKRLASPNG